MLLLSIWFPIYVFKVLDCAPPMLGMLWNVLENSGLGFLYEDYFGLKNYYPCKVIIGILKLLLLCCGDMKSPTLVDLSEGLFSSTMFIWAGTLILLFLRLRFYLWIAVPNIVLIYPELLVGLWFGETPLIPERDLSFAMNELLASIIRLLLRWSDSLMNCYYGPFGTKWGPCWWKFIYYFGPL